MSKVFFRCIQTTALALGVIGSAVTLRGQSAPVAASTLQEQLEAQYPLAKGTSACNIGNPETALVVQKGGGGIRILPLTSTFTIAKCTNRYADGKLSTPNSTCNGEAVSRATDLLQHAPRIGSVFNRGKSKVDDQVSSQKMDVVRTGDNIYPVKLEVNESKAEVKFGLVACKQSNGQDLPYKGELVFQFKNGFLKPENVAQVEDTISEVFSPSVKDQAKAEPPPDSPTEPDQPVQLEQASPSPIEKGQTLEAVRAALGEPEKWFKLDNNKEICIYAKIKMKITFVDGKVDKVTELE